MRITLPNPLGAPLTVDLSLPQRSCYPRTSLQRRARFAVLALVLVVVIFVRPSPPLPPSYALEWAAERSLPQHNPRSPEARNGRYVRFDPPPTTRDLNGQLQAALLHHALAVSANRSFAFEPIALPRLARWTWPWPWRNAHIPLSAVGSIATAARLGRHPPAVSAKHYAAICPRETVITVRGDRTDGVELEPGGRARFEQLVALLAGAEACVRFRGDVFGSDFLETAVAMDMLEDLVSSPAIQHFTLAPRVLGVLNRAMPLLAPSSEHYDLSPSRLVKATRPWKHLLALQVPRSPAFAEHCRATGERSAPFTGFNKLPNLPGNENVPPPPGMTAASRSGLYRAKCLPETHEIIARARRMRKNHPILRAIYLVSDNDEWAHEVGRWLLSDGWDRVFVGRDVYGWDDHETGPAVDLEVARRSGVFVGNGFTNLASNVALLRTRDKVHPDFTQYW